jgi:DNA repair protein SbcC/Rad50
MKILSLKMTNITSLRGVHELPLEELIGEDGLFAITGPTGSGKSSILTSISLALYGQGHKSKLQPQDYVSSEASFGEVELEFLYQHKIYKAYWVCRLVGARGKTLSRPQVQHLLYDNDGPLEILPVDLLGLSFEQFTRTVILNQGEFARFLTSSFTDRKKILEHLYQGDQLTTLNNILRTDLKELKGQKEILETSLETIMPMSEAEYKAILDEQKSIKQKKIESDQVVQEIKSVQKPMERVLGIIKDLESFNEKEIKTRKQLVGLQEASFHHQLVFQQAKNNLEEFKGLLRVIRPTLDDTFKLSESRENLAKQIQEHKRKLTVETDQVKRSEQMIESLGDSLKNCKQRFQEFKNQLPPPWQFDDEQKLLILEENLRVWDKAYDQRDRYKKEILRFKAELEETRLRGTELKEKLTLLPQSEQAAQRETELKAVMSELEKNIVEAQHLQKAIKEGLTDQEERSNELDQMKIELQRLFNDKERFHHLHSNLKLKAENAALKHKLHELAILGLENDSCPLCEGPLTQALKNHLAPKISDHEDMVSSESLKESEENFHRSTLAYQNCQYQVEQRTQDLTKLSEKLQTQQKNLEQVNLEKSQDQLILNTKELKELEAHRLNRLVLEGQIDKERSTYNQLAKSLELASDHELSLDSELREFTELAARANLSHPPQFYLPIIKQLNSILKEIKDGRLRIELEGSVLEKGRQKLRDYEHELNVLNQNYQASIVEWNTLWTTLAAHGLVNHDLIKVQNPKIYSTEAEKRLEWIEQNVKEAELTYLQHKRRCEQSESSLQALQEARKFSFQTLSVHQADLRTPRTLQLEVELERALDKVQQITIESLHGPRADLDLTAELLSSLYEEKLAPRAEQALKDQKELTQKLTEIEIRIDYYNERVKEAQEKQGKLLKLNEQLYIKEELAQVFGRDEFRNFALGLIEAELLQLTNHELLNLCEGRYQLKATKSTFGQDFTLIDRWNGGIERKVETLSGGETFLVSLAMSLSLAEMCRGATEIDCFFIDEGFGSLDQESLDDVLDVLHAIRARGKQLGLISHIKSFTDRLPFIIRLHKNSAGVSQLALE